MWGNMRRILIILLMMAVGVVHARILHVDDNTIKLSQTKNTTPALHVRVGDEVWYGNMTRCPMSMNENTDKKLRVKYNNIGYWVSETEPIKDYVIVDGKLIDANCNIYLETTGTQWIDPMVMSSDDMAYETSIAFTRTDTEQIIGVGGAGKIGASTRLLTKHTEFVWYQSNCCDNDMFLFGKIDTNRHFIKNDFYHKTFQFDSEIINVPERIVLPTSYKLYIGIYSQLGVPRYQWVWYTKIHSFKFYVSDVLIRHFVPVPRGLQIGDFVVPENGMWDIVEQKFYGNMGSGEFIYGVDE